MRVGVTENSVAGVIEKAIRDNGSTWSWAITGGTEVGSGHRTGYLHGVTQQATDKTIAKKAGENPLFKKVLDSQKAFAQRAGQWQNDYSVDYKMAFNHYFGAKKS